MTKLEKTVNIGIDTIIETNKDEMYQVFILIL